MGGRQARDRSHTKAPCSLRGLAAWSAQGPRRGLRLGLRLGFQGRQSCMGVSNERPGQMRRVRGVSSSLPPDPRPRDQLITETALELRERGEEVSREGGCRGTGSEERVGKAGDGHGGQAEVLRRVGWGKMGQRWGGVTWGCGGSMLNSSAQNRRSSIQALSHERIFFLQLERGPSKS